MSKPDLQALNQKRVDDLVDREPAIAVALEACCAEAECGLLICAECSEKARKPYIAELLRVEDMYQGPHEIGTAFLAAYPPGSLVSADVKREHDMLRKQLHRNGFTGSLAMGGTEAAWSERQGFWIVHVHFLAIGVPDEAWSELRTTLQKSGLKFPPKRQALNNLERQISYLQKFATFHRPAASPAQAGRKPCRCHRIASPSWPAGGGNTRSMTSLSCSELDGGEVEYSLRYDGL
jgi:hypothetical protein